ncbi:MAG: protein kinase [Sandaracinaceae bacterium]|jgi:serine/threonine protein kinase|nr:protein kinase [Sandaracinaceae bacterium]MBP7683668.1 protein kinase [Deltaproteobacteria bacterium]MBK6809256.1 protein kinase [Sandaracinaceae bacterium]MBK7776196.1 protein kinase [Sandaracinaceae bacterium]MBK8407726.1 protein kinase [Sandaracinaceae bacterium]
MVTAYSRDSDPLVGTTIADKYRVVSLIARGGMGRVYRGLQLALEREVALKVLDLGRLGESGSSEAVIDDFRRRFVLEAASAAKLTHPNTIVIHDYGVERDGLLYMVMELIEGQTLAERIEKDGALRPETVVRIMAQVCGSLAEAHGRGMVHRDLKPSNIMLTQRGSEREFVKVLDFGLVKQGEDISQTRSGALIGTPRYMSPEQVAGSEVTPASDVYGLGACTYHALTGQPPFDSESAYVLMAAHVNVKPPAMAEVDPGLNVPAELEQVVFRCLSKSPADRYATMEDVSTAMQEALGDDFTLSGSRSLVRTNSSPLGRLPSKDWTDSLADTRVQLHTPTISTQAPPQRRLAMAVLALVGVLVVALGLTWQRARDGGSAGSDASNPQPGAGAQAVAPSSVDGLGRVEVWVRSTPAGARVARGDEDLGNTPARLLLAPEDRWTLTLSARGHAPRTLRVSAAQREVNVVLEPEAAQDVDAVTARPETGSTGERPHTSGSRAPGSGGTSMETTTGPAPGPSEASGTPPGERHTDNRDPWDSAP